jgi:hypothetical protein
MERCLAGSLEKYNNFLEDYYKIVNVNGDC